MKTEFIYDNFPDDLKKRTRFLWHQKQKRIQALLKRFAQQEIRLRLILSGTHDQHQVRALLMLPQDTIVAEVSGRTLDGDLEVLSEKLAIGICQHKDSLRQQMLRQRKGRREQEFQSITSWLDADQKTKDHAAISRGICLPINRRALPKRHCERSLMG